MYIYIYTHIHTNKAPMISNIHLKRTKKDMHTNDKAPTNIGKKSYCTLESLKFEAVPLCVSRMGQYIVIGLFDPRKTRCCGLVSRNRPPRG